MLMYWKQLWFWVCFGQWIWYLILDTLIPWYLDTWYLDTLIPWYLDTLIPWYLDTWYLDTWYLDTLIPWYLDTLIPWYLIPWYLDTLIPWYLDISIHKSLAENRCMIIVYALYVAFLCFLLLRWFCCTMFSYVCFYFLTDVICMIIVCAWELSFEHDHCICKNSTSSVLSVCFLLLRWFCCFMYSYDCSYFLTQERCMIIVYAPYYCKNIMFHIAQVILLLICFRMACFYLWNKVRCMIIVCAPII
jgi:hypothetical protein